VSISEPLRLGGPGEERPLYRKLTTWLGSFWVRLWKPGRAVGGGHLRGEPG